MRVCVVGPAPPLRGGIAVHTAGLAAALRGRGHEVGVVSYSRLYPQMFFPGAFACDDGAAVGTALLDTMKPSTWLRARTVVAETSPQVLIAQWWHPCAAAALATVLGAAASRVVVVCHNARPHDTVPLWRPLTRLVLRNADLVLCHSHFVAREITRLGIASESAVTPMPLLLSPGTAPPRERASGPVALFAGLVRRYKGIEILLEAWDRAALPAGARLLIAGESYLGRGKLEAMIQRLGRRDSVEVIGRWLTDTELWNLLLAADVAVLPYLRASQSGLLPLALAAGLRVVASDAGGLAEGIGSGSKHVVCKAGDPRSLADALSVTLVHAAKGQGNAARRDVADMATVVRDSWDGTVDACERVAR